MLPRQPEIGQHCFLRWGSKNFPPHQAPRAADSKHHGQVERKTVPSAVFNDGPNSTALGDARIPPPANENRLKLEARYQQPSDLSKQELQLLARATNEPAAKFRRTNGICLASRRPRGARLLPEANDHYPFPCARAQHHGVWRTGIDMPPINLHQSRGGGGEANDPTRRRLRFRGSHRFNRIPAKCNTTIFGEGCTAPPLHTTIRPD